MPSRLHSSFRPLDFSKIQAVIFDMDGLLLDTERLFLKAYQQAANELGIDLPESLYLNMLGHRADASQSILRQGLATGAPIEEIIDYARRYYYRAIEQDGIPLRPGAVETVAYCRQQELPIAVATSTHRALAHTKLERAGLLKCFQAVVSGDEVEHGKPAPDIYLAAAQQLSTPPSGCLVLEDSPPGLQAARAASTQPVLIPDLYIHNSETEQFAAAVYTSLNHFLESFSAARQAA